MAKRQEPRYERFSILFVDDDDATRLLVPTVLKRVAGEIVVASDGQEAIEQLQKRPFDLLVTDLKMPRMDGWELIQASKALKSPPALIVVTAHVGESQLHQEVEALLYKPVPLPDLVAAVERVAARSTS